MKTEKESLIGNTYGYLFVVSRCYDDSKYICYNCLCNKCGQLIKVRKDALKKQKMCLNCSHKDRVGQKNRNNKGTMLKKIGALTKMNKSGVVGVNWDKSRNKWQASIRYKNKKIYLGRFEHFDDAVKARKNAERKIHDEYNQKGDN